MSDRHVSGYFKQYHQKIKEDALRTYGGCCSCLNCINHRVMKKSEQKILRIFLTSKERLSQGQYGISAYLKKIQYKKGAAIILCRNCYLGKHMCDNTQYSKKYLQVQNYFKKYAYNKRRR